MIGNKYDPRLKKAAELEQTLAAGEKILKELIEELTPRTQGELSRQSWIITGPRGIGKSHLISLLYHKIQGDQVLSRHWHPVLFPEELFGVDSLYRLFLKVFEYLFRSSAEEAFLEEIKQEYLKIKKIRITGNIKQKKESRHNLAKQLYQLLVKLKERTAKPFILMLENLQYLLKDQLSADDVRLLRSLQNEYPGVLIIIGTALAVFGEIEDYGKPFYRYFRVRRMGGLDRQGIIRFLTKMAAFRKDTGLELKIRNNRRFIYLYQLLTGGNPRLILFLYELLLDHEILDTMMIMEKVTELTPYFLDKTREESGQRKLILEALATEAPAQTAGEIAEYINEDPKSISEQLKRLAAEGWIREVKIEAENVKSKEVFFILRDYFYRIWYRVRMKGIEESDLLCMAELAVLLFDRKEIEQRLEKHAGRDDRHIFYEKSLMLAKDDQYMKNINLLLQETRSYEEKEFRVLIDKLESFFKSEDWPGCIQVAEEMLSYENAQEHVYFIKGIGHYLSGDHKKAVECYKRAVEINPDKHEAWFDMGNSYAELEDYEKALECYKRAAEIKPDMHEGWFNMGNSYAKLEGHEKALDCYNRAVEINPADHEGWFNMGNSHAKLEDYEKALDCYNRAVEIKPDKYEAWFNLGNSSYKIDNHETAYNAYSLFIQHAFKFEPFDFSILKKLQTVAGNIFSSSGELKQLLDDKTSPVVKLESICRLTLLGKLASVTDELDQLLEETQLPVNEAKKLEFILLAAILGILEDSLNDPELKILIKYWIILISRTGEPKDVKRKFLEFFYFYVQIAGRERINPDLVEEICEQLVADGIETSGMILKIIEAIKNPKSREAQQWMPDPLFAAIVHDLM